jgi:hypothetical protein
MARIGPRLPLSIASPRLSMFTYKGTPYQKMVKLSLILERQKNTGMRRKK